MSDDDRTISADRMIERLFAVIESRRNADPEQSYVAKLMARGLPKIAQKVGEEATELVIASVAGSADETISESADLLFHLMVLWAAKGVAPQDIAAEFVRREGISGIAEKKNRKQ